MIEIKFARLTEKARIPTKRDEDAGYDIYADMRNNWRYVIEPHTTELIPTGIASIIPRSYCFILKERGSTGTKGMAQRCGVIDSGYRGEWFIPITNTNNHSIVIYNDAHLSDYRVQNQLQDTGDLILYPASKAICQALLIEVPQTKITEITIEELETDKTERGEGKLGSSGK